MANTEIARIESLVQSQRLMERNYTKPMNARKV